MRQPEIRDPQVAAPVHQQVGGFDVAVDDSQLMGILQRQGGLNAQVGRRAEEQRAFAGALGGQLGRCRLGSGIRGCRRGREREGGIGPCGLVRFTDCVGRIGNPSDQLDRGVGGARWLRHIQSCPVSPLPNQGRQGLAFDVLHGVEVHAAFGADGEDRHDIGMVQMGGRLRLVLEALQLLGVECGRERQHLQCHPPTQRDLLGLIDDAHTAPADLAQDAVIAQGPHGIGLGGSSSAVLRAGGSATQLVHDRQGGHQLTDLTGQLRILSCQRFHVGRPAGAQRRLHFLGHQAIDQVGAAFRRLQRRIGNSCTLYGITHGLDSP